VFLFVLVLSGILLHPYITTRTQDRTNIVFAHLALTKLRWDKDTGCYRKPELMAPTAVDQGLFANIAPFANESTVDEQVISAGRVKAQLTYTIGGDKYPASPGVWVDSQLNAVSFDVGDTRYLILSLGSHLHTEWHTVVNRRATPDEPIATTGAFDLWPGSQATIELHLLNEHGGIVRAYQMQWKWEWNYTPRIFGLKQLRSILQEALVVRRYGGSQRCDFSPEATCALNSPDLFLGTDSVCQLLPAKCLAT